jgi:hypothetical protein
MTKPYQRAFLIGALLFVGVALKMLSRHSGPWSTYPLSELRFLVAAWIVAALLVGFVCTRFQALRSWVNVGVLTVIGWFAVMGLTLAVLAARPTQTERRHFATTDEMMVHFADEAAQWVKQDTGIDLDYSLGSVGIVETQLDGLSKQFNKSHPQKGMFGQAAAYGAYVGEVIRKKYGGTWAVDDRVGGIRSYPLTIKSNQVFYPVAWCWRRIVNGEEDNIIRKVEILTTPGVLKGLVVGATNEQSSGVNTSEKP